MSSIRKVRPVAGRAGRPRSGRARSRRRSKSLSLLRVAALRGDVAGKGMEVALPPLATQREPMKKAKVLIVDDAMLIRRLVSEAIAADAAIEVVGEAANGRIALQKIAQLNPDLVTLDIEMPEMDGLTTLRAIRKTYPRLPVVMFSALTERGAADTLEALHIGASDYVTKPSSTAGKSVAQQRISQDLVPKIRSLCRVGVGTGSSRSEEHTSELQSLRHLVCRLLLE